MITPFSGKNWSDNADRAGHKELTPCVVCGKGVVHKETAHWVVVINGGLEFGYPDSDANDPGYMGCFPVGPECWRQHKDQLAKHEEPAMKDFPWTD